MFDLGKELLEEIEQSVTNEELTMLETVEVSGCYGCSGECSSSCKGTCHGSCAYGCGGTCSGHTR